MQANNMDLNPNQLVFFLGKDWQNVPNHTMIQYSCTHNSPSLSMTKFRAKRSEQVLLALFTLSIKFELKNLFKSRQILYYLIQQMIVTLTC